MNHPLIYILAGLLLTAVIVFLLIYFIRRKVGNATRQTADLGQMMDQVLNMGNYFVVEWDFSSNMLRNKYGNMLPGGSMKPEEFLRRMPPEEAQQLHNLNAQLATGAISHFSMNLGFNQGTPEQPEWRYFYGNAIAEMENGKPLHILYTTKDTTDEVLESRRIKAIASKYKKMFDTNLVAMSFYSADGHLIDLNNKMYELCEMQRGDEEYFRKSTLFSFPTLKDVYLPGSRETLHVCQHLKEPQLGIDKYIEFRIYPAMNDDGTFAYYIVTSRDVTAERNMHLEQRKHDQQLHAANKAIKRHEKQLSYLLDECQMYLWSYHIAENMVNITRSPGQTQFCETIEEYLQTINAEARQQATAEMLRAIEQAKPYNTILPYDRTPLDNQPTWYSVSGIPLFNKDGQLTEFFGVSRNITDLMLAQEKLRIETARAEDSGRLKAAFLANMTHEIRTPLNAIVGFSDLLPTIDDDNEKKEFIRIIRNNCDMLLRLINDILEVSNIGQSLKITPADVDFPKVFDDICQTLEQRVQEAGVTFLKDNPYEHLHIQLDKGRIQQVVTNFVTNAVKYTKQGHIKVGYKTAPAPLQHSGGTPHDAADSQPGLYIYCEDTGAGIPKDKQDSVFERFVKLNDFVQGTGLGLSICKTIAERCGGCIGVHSDGEGKGSTFWIWIPCALPDSHPNHVNPNNSITKP